MEAEPRTRKLVVAALIVGRGGEILVTQRREDQAHPLGWEFPGGKVEPGEAPAAALERELREELGVTVRVGRVWDVVFHAYPDADVYMLVYRCELPAGQAPRAIEVRAIAWVTRDRLGEVDVLPADAPIVARLRAEGA